MVAVDKLPGSVKIFCEQSLREFHQIDEGSGLFPS